MHWVWSSKLVSAKAALVETYSVCNLLTPLVVRGYTLQDGAQEIPLIPSWVLILKGPARRRTLLLLDAVCFLLGCVGVVARGEQHRHL